MVDLLAQERLQILMLRKNIPEQVREQADSTRKEHDIAIANWIEHREKRIKLHINMELNY